MANGSKKSNRWVTPLAWVMGLVFLAAAFLKAWDIPQFANQISAYRMLPDSLIMPAAMFVVVVEAFIGICIITGFQRTLALCIGAGLLAFFLLATGLRWNDLQGTDCGCFGSFDRGGPEAVLWQDPIFLILLGVIFKYRAQAKELNRKILATVLVSVLCLALAGYSVFSARSGVASLNQAVEGQLNIIVYLSATCPHCIANGERINRILTTPNIPPAQTYLAAANDAEVVDFLQKSHLSVPYKVIPLSFLFVMVKSVPTLEVRRGEEIIARWSGDMPTPEEVLSSFAGSSSSADQRKSSSGS
jgi:uncharacterized membrane protein YphA (DoxX/SURF4 family)